MRHSLGQALRPRTSIGSKSTPDEREPDGDETIVEPDQNNILSHIISQLRPGADLSRITLPTFILEERSMLERITNFMASPDTLLPMPEIDDPVQRFVSVIRFYLSGWHIRPAGVKKPLNPILGETFTCWWEYPDQTKGYYIAEQTSHHPPKSSYFFMAPEHHIRVDGTLKPKSRFLGNSAASMMEGISYLRFTNRGTSKLGEKYILTQPNMYARGILFGKMKYELGDHSFVRCPENRLSADIEFKTKGWVSGTYNAIGGYIKNDKTGEQLYELSGFWSGPMYIKDLKTGLKDTLFDATRAKHAPPLTRPIEQQRERESQRLWLSTVKAVHVSDHVKATDEKAKIEDRQREEARQREETGQEWKPTLFRRVDARPGGSEEGEADLEWIINAEIDPHDPKKAIKQILSIAPILPSSGSGSANVPQSSASNPISSVTASNKGNNASDTLIDLDSHPPSKAPPSGHPQPNQNHLLPTSNHTQAPAPAASAPKSTNLLDDDDYLTSDVNSGLSNLNLNHVPVFPTGTLPLKRADTATGDTDVFVDAEG
ncbi:hypothetical protein DV736_g5452, partial [Chaetothyriales sp. CBS 134916]